MSVSFDGLRLTYTLRPAISKQETQEGRVNPSYAGYNGSRAGQTRCKAAGTRVIETIHPKST
jgi:hypothetical protein